MIPDEQDNRYPEKYGQTIDHKRKRAKMQCEFTKINRQKHKNQVVKIRTRTLDAFMIVYVKKCG